MTSTAVLGLERYPPPMSGTEWTALILQGIAALSAAVAAVFAWLTARSVDRRSQNEARIRADEHLKSILRLITGVVDAVHNHPKDDFIPKMHLRAELGVTYVELPLCLELVDPARGDLSLQAFDRLAAEALSEVEAARKEVWNDEIRSGR